MNYELDPNTIAMLSGQQTGVDPMARVQAIHSFARGTPEQQAQVNQQHQQTIQNARDQMFAGTLMAGAGDQHARAMAPDVYKGGQNDETLAYKYSPEQKASLFEKTYAQLLGKLDTAQTNSAAKLGATDLANKGKAVVADINGKAKVQAASQHQQMPKMLRDDDGNQYWASPGQAPTLISDEQGNPIQLKKAMSSGEINTMTGFDSAQNRLALLKQAFAKGLGTYPGASSLHELAQVFNAADPEFAALKTLSGGHLLKGIKADIGGRVTNFEIKYGSNIFPTENDRPDVAMAKIARIEQMLGEDKQNYAATLRKAGRKTPGSGRPAAAAPAEGPADLEYDPVTKSFHPAGR